MNFLKLKDLGDLKKFIKKNWNKNHIFVKNEKLILWQHLFVKNRLDFFVKKDKNKIIALLGIINQSRDKKYSEISLAIWISKVKSYGAKLYLNLEKILNFKIVKGTTVDESIIPIYKLLGFKVKKFNIFYLTPFSEKKRICSINLISSKPINKGTLEILNLKQIMNLKEINKDYIKWRFINHPVYNYLFLSDNRKKLVLIYRAVEVNNIKFMRIVDFIGSFKDQKKTIIKLNNFLFQNKFEYMEFFHYGSQDKYIKASGLKKLNNKQKIVMYSEPYKGLSYRDFYCCYKTNKVKKIKIVRADGDFDRPSVIIS